MKKILSIIVVVLFLPVFAFSEQKAISNTKGELLGTTEGGEAYITCSIYNKIYETYFVNIHFYYKKGTSEYIEDQSTIADAGGDYKKYSYTRVFFQLDCEREWIHPYTTTYHDANNRLIHQKRAGGGLHEPKPIFEGTIGWVIYERVCKDKKSLPACQ